MNYPTNPKTENPAGSPTIRPAPPTPPAPTVREKQSKDHTEGEFLRDLDKASARSPRRSS